MRKCPDRSYVRGEVLIGEAVPGPVHLGREFKATGDWITTTARRAFISVS